MPLCSPQGKWVFYFDMKAQANPWMRVPLEGGKTEALPRSGVPGSAVFPLSGISQDDLTLSTFATLPDDATNSYKKKIVIINADSLDAPFRLLDPDPRLVAFNVLSPRFTPDGKALVYPISGENNAQNLWLQPVDGKPGHQLTHFASEQIFAFSWSPDGKRLLVERGHNESDVVLVRDTSK